ncbi:hypothetical protein [Candidatus Poriferisodalis sp.]|uniref:hypothetical protein n=1 Tax=Candidatus Poriferisodalis sp. TaxID=3101277 RepID=UPI003B02599F
MPTAPRLHRSALRALAGGALLATAVAVALLVWLWTRGDGEPTDAAVSGVAAVTSDDLRAGSGGAGGGSGSEDDLWDVALPDAAAVWERIAADYSLDPDRRYSDEELGLYAIVDKMMFYRSYFARARTAEAYHHMQDERYDRAFIAPSGHERDRLNFELDAESQLLLASRDAAFDLSDEGPLWQAYVEWMLLCLSDAGFPAEAVNPETGEEIPIYEAEDEQLAGHVSSTGFTRDQSYDLRYDCAQRAVTYPTLDPQTRDGLLDRLRRHYLESLHCVLDNCYLAEVPLVEPAGWTTPVLENSTGRGCDKDQPDPATVDLDTLTYDDLHGPVPGTAQRLSVYAHFEDVGVLEFVEDYIAGFPNQAWRVALDELAMVQIGNYVAFEASLDVDSPTHQDQQRLRFERAVIGVAGTVVEEVASKHGDYQILLDAFHDAVDDCARDALGADAGEFSDHIRDLVVPGNFAAAMNRVAEGGYPSGLGYYHYLELRHECLRGAVTYPSLFPEQRDELLAEQRARFARELLERLDNDRPNLEVPPEYQNQLNQLRRRSAS